jgi:hypothetical protein
MNMLADALLVQAQGAAVRSLRDRGLTWVSFDPMPQHAGRIDFAMRKLPDFGLLILEPCRVSKGHARRAPGQWRTSAKSGKKDSARADSGP